MLRPFFPELVMSTDLLIFEHPSVLIFCFEIKIQIISFICNIITWNFHRFHMMMFGSLCGKIKICVSVVFFFDNFHTFLQKIKSSQNMSKSDHLCNLLWSYVKDMFNLRALMMKFATHAQYRVFIPGTKFCTTFIFRYIPVTGNRKRKCMFFFCAGSILTKKSSSFVNSFQDYS